MEKIFECFVFSLITCSFAQDTHVTINQGRVVGLKVFPETSRTPVYTFLGIPYAEPPIGSRRFSRPNPHGGWNQTYFAREIKPICPQPKNSIYDERNNDQLSVNSPMDENCLFLNIWTPEIGLRYGNLPVLVILTGEEMTFDWPHNRPIGLDLASENIVVVTIQYRTNVFGFLAVNDDSINGNYGLYDQQLGLKWIQQNIDKFGGNPHQTTLLGHGTTGAVCALIHLSYPKNGELFSKAIIMSGNFNDKRIINTESTKEVSRAIVQKLGCYSRKSVNMIKCLNAKSTGDIQLAFETIYNFSNFSKILGPVTENNGAIIDAQFNLRDLQLTLKSPEFRHTPILIGICSNEGAFTREFWIDLARKNFSSLSTYIDNIVIPQLLSKNFGVYTVHSQILKTIKWKYFEQYPKSASYLLNSLQRLISESEYENSFYTILETIAKNYSNTSQTETGSLFAYAFQKLHSMDMRGKVNLFGGASHSSDLPILMGPSLFQQIARRRFTPTEDKLCKKMRQFFTDFMKTGNPTPGRIYDAWLPYTERQKSIKIIGDKLDTGKPFSFSQFEQNLPIIEEMLKKDAGLTQKLTYFQSRQNPYTLAANNDESALTNTRPPKNSYLTNKQDYEYFQHLQKVDSFWNVLIPSIYDSITLERQNIENNSIDRSEREILFLESDSLRYKHAFFSMLALVCLLLAILGIFVYILKKSHQNIGTNL